MPKKKTPYDIECGHRLRLGRQALEMKAVEMAAAIGVSKAKYSNWERGENGAPPDELVKVKREFGISLDWIYANDIASLRSDIGDKVRKRLLAEVAQGKGRKSEDPAAPRSPKRQVA